MEKRTIIELNADSSKIILRGLDDKIAEDLKTGSLSRKDWQKIYPVYIGAGEREDLQVSGTYSINATTVTFSPDSAFRRDSSYAALFFYPRYYSVTNVLNNRSIPGRIKVIEGYFQF